VNNFFRHQKVLTQRS